jgi:hypothetical protein
VAGWDLMDVQAAPGLRRVRGARVQIPARNAGLTVKTYHWANTAALGVGHRSD